MKIIQDNPSLAPLEWQEIQAVNNCSTPLTGSTPLTILSLDGKISVEQEFPWKTGYCPDQLMRGVLVNTTRAGKNEICIAGDSFQERNHDV